jgi:hypothetical protein
MTRPSFEQLATWLEEIHAENHPDIGGVNTMLYRAAKALRGWTVDEIYAAKPRTPEEHAAAASRLSKGQIAP